MKLMECGRGSGPGNRDYVPHLGLSGAGVRREGMPDGRGVENARRGRRVVMGRGWRPRSVGGGLSGGRPGMGGLGRRAMSGIDVGSIGRSCHSSVLGPPCCAPFGRSIMGISARTRVLVA